MRTAATTLIAFGSILAWPSAAWGHDCATVSNKQCASDGSLADTQAAINYIHNKDEDGWVLTVGDPDGVYTWSGSVTGPDGVTYDYLDVDVANRTFTMRGADPSHRPSITSTTTAGSAVVVIAGNHLVVIKDMKFVEWHAGNSLIGVYGGGPDPVFHFTNCYFHGSNTYFLWTSGPFVFGGAGPFGLVDHCDLWDTGSYVRQNHDSPDFEWTNNHWDTDQTNTGPFGSAQAVFIEDCTYHNRGGSAGGFDGDTGGKYVIRHNVINNGRVAWHGRDSSNQGSTCKNGFLAGEIYDNTWNISVDEITGENNGPSDALVTIRGGTALVYNNGLNIAPGSSVGNGVSLQNYCSGANYTDGCRDPATCMALTGPQQYPADYPALQQPGTPVPVRVWHNGFSAVGADPFTQLDRDFFYSVDDSAALEGYTAYPYPHPLNTGSVPTSPSNNIPPLVRGVAVQPQTLTVLPGSWSAYPAATLSYQWVKCDESETSCSSMSDATSASYLLTSADLGSRIAVDETATNIQGSATKRSNYTEVVAAPGAENRLTNGGFEAHTGAVELNLANNAAWSGWVVTEYGNGWIMSSTDSHAGGYAFKIFKNGGTTPMAIEQPFVPASPGETMTVSFWQKNSLPTYHLAYSIVDVTHNANIIGPIKMTDSIDSYTKTEFTFVVPPGCDAAKIVFDSSQLGAAGDANAWLDDVTIAPPPQPNLMSVVSRQLHASTTDFDIPLPLSGAVGVEPRSGGPNHAYRFVLTFDSAVTFSGAAITSGVGDVAAASGSGTAIAVVDLTGVPDAQVLQVMLQGVSAGATPIDLPVSAGFLLGDVNGDGIVNSADATLSRNSSGQKIDASNFRLDVNLDGSINAGDSTIIRNNSGQSLPVIMRGAVNRVPIEDWRPTSGSRGPDR